MDAVHLYGPNFTARPYETYRTLRERGPIHRVVFPSGVRAWLVTGYDAALERLTDRGMGKDHRLGNDQWRRRASIMPEPYHSRLQAHLLHRDSPQHTIMRQPVSAAFRAAAVGAWTPMIEREAQRQCDELAHKDYVDLVEDFAAPLVFRILAAAIGLPADLAEGFDARWTKAVQPVGPDMPGRAAYIQLLSELETYIDRVIAEKETSPSNDVLGTLVAMRREGQLSSSECRSTIFQLLVAGQEPVTNMICNGMLALLTNADQRALFCSRTTERTAVDELMRFDGSFELATWRFFETPTRVSSVTVPAGDAVIVSLAAANRDPARFADPDCLQLDREPNPHLSLGYGPHYCPAAQLARAEVSTALTALFDRFPHMTLAVSPDELKWIPAALSRGVSALPVKITRAAHET